MLIHGPSEHHPGLEIEVAGLPVDRAQRLLAELDRLRTELNVYRGHLLDVSITPALGAIRAAGDVTAHHPSRRITRGRVG